MNYHNITKDDMLNGEGLRVVLWVSGCTQNCKGCHNPRTHDFNSGIPFDDKAKQEIFEQLDKDYIQGLTLSGGHPLETKNIEECTKLCREVKQKYPTKDIWVYTGYTYESIKDLEILKYVDVLVDGKFVEELKDENAEWVGSTNQRVIRLCK